MCLSLVVSVFTFVIDADMLSVCSGAVDEKAESPAKATEEVQGV